jgi:hypothetical protein
VLEVSDQWGPNLKLEDGNTMVHQFFLIPGASTLYYLNLKI